MIQLVLVALTVFWVWEYLLLLSPWTLPVWLQPLLVIAAATGATYLPHKLLLVGAVAGFVALLHQVMTTVDVLTTVRSIRRIPRI